MEKPLSYPNQQISIHVPSWGTTRSLFDLPFPLPISIHVPSWGTTSMLAGCGKAYPFQSTFPRGERRTGGSQAVAACNFNPRSLVGNDGLHFHRDWRRFISIHVPSWGTTAVKKNTSQDETDFNPRSLVGNDEGGGFAPLKKVISIHVPSWGTTGDFARTSGSWAFQSTFPRGERLARLGKFGWTALFQSTFPRGERQFCFLLELAGDKFQSTFPRGERHSIHPPNRQDNNFNPRSLVGNDANPIEINVRISFISIHVPSWGTTANFHKYSLFFYAINIIFLLFIIPSLFSLVLFMLLF